MVRKYRVPIPDFAHLLTRSLQLLGALRSVTLSSMGCSCRELSQALMLCCLKPSPGQRRWRREELGLCRGAAGAWHGRGHGGDRGDLKYTLRGSVLGDKDPNRRCWSSLYGSLDF